MSTPPKLGSIEQTVPTHFTAKETIMLSTEWLHKAGLNTVWQRAVDMGSVAFFVAINVVLVVGVTNMVSDYGATYRIAPPAQDLATVPTVVVTTRGAVQAVAALDSNECRRTTASPRRKT
jgi:hypothetical protein